MSDYYLPPRNLRDELINTLNPPNLNSNDPQNFDQTNQNENLINDPNSSTSFSDVVPLEEQYRGEIINLIISVNKKLPKDHKKILPPLEQTPTYTLLYISDLLSTLLNLTDRPKNPDQPDTKCMLI